MADNRWFGYKIEEVEDGKWVYADNGELVSDLKERPCGFCGEYRTKEGHDGCLGTLEGVMNACCGHGDLHTAYVMFSQDEILRGKEAIEYSAQAKGRCSLWCSCSTKEG